MRRILAAALLVLLSCSKTKGSTSSALTSAPDGGASTSTTSSSSSGGTNPGTTDDGGSLARYDEVVMKAIHNSYQRDEPLIDQLLFHRARNVEIDIHNGKGADAPAGQWYVYHIDLPTQDGSSCTMLSDCLGLLKAFHDAIPTHEVVTVYIDLKDLPDDGHQPADLDNAITSVIGKENIVAPADVIAQCNGATTLSAAVTKPCGFPTLASLRGKFIFAGTGGTLCDSGSQTTAYAGAKPSDRLMFTAPNLDSTCDLTAYQQHPDVAIMNMEIADKALAQPAKDKGFVGRMYHGGITPSDGLDSEDDWNTAKSAGVSQLATDEVNAQQDPWSTTTGAKGYPFLVPGSDTLVEGGAVFGLSATSGDQWDTADSGFYAYENDTTESAWTAMISVPSSHTEEFAKACLSARASEDPGAANVAFCRPFDNNPPRLQVRTDDGASTSTQDAPSFDGLSAETGVFMKLAFAPADGATAVTASVSKDGQAWVDVGTVTVNAALPLRGVSLSSHGSGQQRALFAAVKRSQVDVPAETITASRLTQTAIGDGATGAAFDGIFGP